MHVTDSDKLACEGQTASLARIIGSDPRFGPHKKGHTKKVLRYSAIVSGNAIAIEKRIGPPSVYVEASVGGSIAKSFCSTSIKNEGLIGRNSNLAAIFADARLLCVKIYADVEFRALLDCLA
jgi:hypothetical protein